MRTRTRVGGRPERSGRGTRQRADVDVAAGRAPAPEHADLLRLQRLAGNQSVSRLLVQRHLSWEHMLMGETSPQDLGLAVAPGPTRDHVLAREYQRITSFHSDAGFDPHGHFSDYRWIQLRTSGLWLTYGELNALADYLPTPEAYDTLGRDIVLPVVQRMRYSILEKVAPLIRKGALDMEGMANQSWLPESMGGEVRSLDIATAGEGTDRYVGLLARNACHFAPMSWERWSHFHAQAREEAARHHETKNAVGPVTYTDASAEEHERQAILNSGYADHFIQDSFAAGHLIDKTLVMQYYIDYLNQHPKLRTGKGMPDAEVLASMGSADQPGISDKGMYGHPPTAGETPAQDREEGTGATDPQTGQERRSREHRVEASGVVAGGGRSREQNYQAYLRFLNNSLVQLASGEVHDWLNVRGLRVVNGEGTELRIGGDDTLISQSSQLGAETAGRAAQLSRQAVDDILTTGKTAITVERIWQLVPQWVLVDTPSGQVRASLADWNETFLRDLCFREVFPGISGSIKGQAVRSANSGEMVTGGVSRDAGR